MPEHWQPVSRYPNYEVSDLGRVRSIRHRTSQGMRGGRLLTPMAHKKWGHCRVKLYRDGVFRRVMVHELVLEAFVKRRPKGRIGRHLDGNPSNNVPSNLAWGTTRQNHQDRERHGRTARGALHGNVKLTESQVIAIRLAVDRKETKTSIAARYGINRTTVSRIARRKSWGWLADEPASPANHGFQARYNGECDGCGYEFQVGDSIRSDGAGGWLCGTCGEVRR